MADTGRPSMEEGFVDDWADLLTEMPSAKKENSTFYDKWTEQGVYS